jgi:ribonucleotide monophosphatase NagD (HAD superfamily)
MASFLRWIKKNVNNYLFLTNSRDKSPQQLSQRLAGMGIEVSTHLIQKVILIYLLQGYYFIKYEAYVFVHVGSDT